MQGYNGNPEEFVRENQDTLVRLLKHSDDEFVRGIALAALLEYGEDPQIEDVLRELERAKDDTGGMA